MKYGISRGPWTPSTGRPTGLVAPLATTSWTPSWGSVEDPFGKEKKRRKLSDLDLNWRA